ncbi:MAG: HAD-IA family hydrolase [Nitrospinae bacterium]|nr:HAD-IA family hydrolase [Nitrospinota bacterium]
MEAQKFDVDVLVFDLDGTLIDSKQDIADSLNWTFGQFGYEPLPMNLIEQFVGNGIAPLINRAVNQAGHPERETEVLKVFRARYYEHLLDQTMFFPGVEKTLNLLKSRYKMGLVTNKPHQFTEKIVAKLGLDSYFNGEVYGGDTLPVKKPDPASILRISSRYGVSPSRVLMVGDSSVDVMTGKNAGSFTVGVTYGFRSVEELIEAKPDAMIDRFEQLTGLLA